MAGARSFGNVRRLPSGKWQARYLGPDGLRRTAPHTFDTKTAAARWLRLTESELTRGEWTDPEKARVTVEQYAEQWIRERPGLRPRTVELYRWLLRKHIAPHLGGVELGRLTTALVRRWRTDLLLESGVSISMAAKCYRLLRAVLNTAAGEDQIIRVNPCRVRGADRENPAERPVPTMAQVFALAERMPPRYRALVLVTALTSLRWGEVTALRRCDLAEDASWVKVSFAHTEIVGRGIVVGPPKSRAGVRTIVVPKAVRADLLAHLREFTEEAGSALVFTGEKRKALRRSNFSQRVEWPELVAELGMKGLHFHDLRHAGNVWAAQTKVSTKDLMARMGHDDMRAALIYQRATQEAADRIADGLTDQVEKHRRPPDTVDDEPDDGAFGALVPVG